jgi:hypothetical protein
VKLVSVPAEAPSVLADSDDGVEASCVISLTSSFTASGVGSFANDALSVAVPPEMTLPVPSKVSVPLPPLSVTPA